MEGWIKSHRKFIEWEWFTTANMFHLFHYLLFKANWENKQWRGIVVKRGQLVTGRNTISKDTGISAQCVRTCIKRLKSTNEITIKSTKAYSIITICNYDLYQPSIEEINQDINQQTNQQLTINQPTTNHNEEYKNDKNDKKERKEEGDLKDIREKSEIFVDKIIDLYLEEDKDYKIVDIEQERKGAKKLIKLFRDKYPDATEEEVINGLQPFFKLCVNIDDDWLRNNMGLPLMATNKFNTIIKILKNGKSGRKQSEATPAQITGIVSRKIPFNAG